MAVSLRIATAAAAAVSLLAAVPAAQAADYQPPIYQEPVVEYHPAPYYARLDCAYGIMDTPEMIVGIERAHFVDKNGGRIDVDYGHYCDLGIGHYFLDHARFDVTVGYRGPIEVSGIADFNNVGGTATNQEAKVRSLVTLFNLYWDIASYYGLTPYVGAGIGFAYNDLDDVLVPESGFYTKGGERFDLAWALMAGVSYPVTDAVLIDAGYRYVNWGGVSSGTMGSHGNFTTAIDIEKLAAHEVRLGVRYNFY